VKTGTKREDDNGNMHFKFDDGTFAIVYWEPHGELGDGDGGYFEEDEIETDTDLDIEFLAKLAHANIGPEGPIVWPEEGQQE
jgi:hypothetical protein